MFAGIMNGNRHKGCDRFAEKVQLMEMLPGKTGRLDDK